MVSKLVPTALVTAGLSLALLPANLGSGSLAQAQTTPVSTLVMGTEADYIPFEFRYAADPPTDIVGFDIAVAQAIAARLGFDLDVQERGFDQLLPGLQAGEFDFAMAALTPTEDRRQQVDFSIAYFESRQALVSRRTSPVRTLADLAGQRIAVQRGTIQEAAVQAMVTPETGATIQPFERVNDMITAVREQQADVAVLEELVAEAYLDNNPTLEMDVLGEIPPTPVAIAFPKGSPYLAAFNQVLQQLESSGELERLARRWFTAQP